MTSPTPSTKPYWRKVLDGEEPVFHDGYSGHDWAEEQRDAYWEALGEAAVEIERLKKEACGATAHAATRSRNEPLPRSGLTNF